MKSHADTCKVLVLGMPNIYFLIHVEPYAILYSYLGIYYDDFGLTAILKQNPCINVLSGTSIDVASGF